MTIRPSSRTAQTVRDLPSAALMTQLVRVIQDCGVPRLRSDDESGGERLRLRASYYTTARVPPIRTGFHSPVYRAAERRKPEHLRIMLIRQIVDATENGQMRADFVFCRKIHKAVILDIKVRSAEI